MTKKIGEITETKTGERFLIDGFRRDSFGEISMYCGRVVKKDGTIDKRYKRRSCEYV